MRLMRQRNLRHHLYHCLMGQSGVLPSSSVGHLNTCSGLRVICEQTPEVSAAKQRRSDGERRDAGAAHFLA